MICYVLAMGKQHLGPHVVVGYGIKIFHYVTRSPGVSSLGINSIYMYNLYKILIIYTL